MTTTLLTKRSTTAGAAPTTAQLAVGELGLNTEDAYLYAKNNAGSLVKRIGTTADRVAFTPESTADAATDLQTAVRLLQKQNKYFPIVSAMLTDPTLLSGDICLVADGTLGKPELFQIVPFASYASSGSPLVQATSVLDGTGHLWAVSLRTKYESYAEAKADPRSITSGYWTMAFGAGGKYVTGGDNWNGVTAGGSRLLVEWGDIRTWGTVADSVTDDHAAIQAAFTAAQLGYPLFIPAGNYHVGSILTINGPVNITSDPNAIFNWHGATTSGIVIDNTTPSTDGNILCCNVDLPRCYGPYANADTSIPGYGGTINYGSITGTFLTITDSSWVNVKWKHIGAWQTAVDIQSVNGSAENVHIDFNVADCCVTGFKFAGSVKGSVDSVQIRGNTLWGQYGHNVDTSTGFVGKIDIDIQSYYLDVPFGYLAYAKGTNGYGINVRCAGMLAGNDANSPSGSGTFKTPLISGDQTVNSETGFWGIPNCSFEINDNPNVFDLTPVAGDGIRAKITGNATRFYVNRINLFGAVVLSQTSGESHYNGGVGSAAMGKSTPVSLSVSSLAAGAEATFYFYHQGVTNSYQPIKFVPTGNLGPLDVYCVPNGPAVNREVKVIAVNRGQTTLASWTAYGVVEMP